jgi:hypothetical protein
MPTIVGLPNAERDQLNALCRQQGLLRADALRWPPVIPAAQPVPEGQTSAGLLHVPIASPAHPEGSLSSAGSNISVYLHSHAVKPQLNGLVRRGKRLAPLLTAPAVLLLSQGQAKAVLNFYIFESGGNVILRGIGSMSLPGSVGTVTSPGCPFYDAITNRTFCIGPNLPIKLYSTIGTSPLLPGNANLIASSSSGLTTGISANESVFGLDPFSDGSSIFSEAIFNDKTLALDFGITTTGLFGTWTLQSNGSDGYTANDTINLYVNAPPTPGPLPLLGAGAAFAWSRKLRKRIGSAAITPPQA